MLQFASGNREQNYFAIHFSISNLVRVLTIALNFVHLNFRHCQRDDNIWRGRKCNSPVLPQAPVYNLVSILMMILWRSSKMCVE